MAAPWPPNRSAPIIPCLPPHLPPFPPFPPALLPTGDPDLDRRLAALSNEVRSKSATVGLLLDMLNATRGEVGGRGRAGRAGQGGAGGAGQGGAGQGGAGQGGRRGKGQA